MRTRMAFQRFNSQFKASMNFFRRLSVFLPLLLGVWAFSARAEIQFDVFLGYDGFVPDACWFPLMIEVKNDGPTFSGHIEVESAAIKRTQSRKVTVELPTGTLKRIFLPVFANGRYRSSWDIRLVDGSGRVRKESLNVAPRRQIPSGVPLMGAMPRKPLGLPEMGKIKNPDSSLQPLVARLLPNTFPENPIELEGLSSIYLNSEVAATLSALQVEALLGWLNQGGHLIIAVEEIADVNTLPWLRSIVPMDLAEVQSVASHSELQDWLVHPAEREKPNSLHYRLKKKKNAQAANPFGEILMDSAFEHSELRVATGHLRQGEVVVSAAKTPLIVEADQGNGKVSVILFSPERKPFTDWKNASWFWSKLSEVPIALYRGDGSDNISGGFSSDGIIGAMIDSRQVRKLPVGWLLLLLLAYLVVIGPLDRYWLKKIKRPMLTWITFPCYVVVFSMLIYFIGYKLRAGEAEWNELHIVDVLPHGQAAELRGHSYMSIYSPINNEYPVANQQKFSVFRSEFQSSWSAGQESERAEIQQTGENFKARIFVPVWTNQLFVSDWWQSSEMPLEVAVSKRGEDWVFKVSNQRDRELQNVTLVVADRVYDLGSIAAKQDKEFSRSVAEGLEIHAMISGEGGEFTQVVQSRQQAFGSTGKSHINDVLRGLKAVTFISEIDEQRFVVPPGLDLSAMVGNDRALVMAWETNYSPIEPMNKFSPRRSAKNTLWRLSVPVVANLNR